MKKEWLRCSALIVAVLAIFLVQSLCSANSAAADIPSAASLAKFEAGRHRVKLPNGETLAYSSIGPPNGRAVVFIHGYLDTGLDWAPLLPYFDRSYHLILVDQRGHGDSSAPECCYSRFDLAYDIKLLLEHLKIERADLVGHSLGSVVAQTVAERWPEQVRDVVLIGSTGGPRREGSAKPKGLDLWAEVNKLDHPMDADSPAMVDWFSSPHQVVSEQFLHRQRAAAASIPFRVWRDVLEQNTFEDLQRTLPMLKAPALLMWGSEDPIMDDEVRQTLIEALPKAQVRIFPGMGHQPFWEVPQECAEAITAFLSSHQ